jgi:hypothetical protein
MKEGALIGGVTIGLLTVLVAIVASGIEDSGVITMARHFPVSRADLANAETLGRDYAHCRSDFVHQNRARYAVASMLSNSSNGVCSARLAAISRYLQSRGYSEDVVARETRYIQAVDDADTRTLIAALYQEHR